MKIRIYLILILIYLFSSALLFFLFILPKSQSLFFLIKEISQKESSLSIQQEYFQELQKTSEELKKYEETFLKIDLALPPEPYLSLAELLNFLQKSSSQSGLSLKKISSVSVSPKEDLKESKIELILNGSYPSFKNFLSVLEKSARLIKIERISFSVPERREEDETFDFNLTIKVYSY